MSTRIEVNRPQSAASGSSPDPPRVGWWARVVEAPRWEMPYLHICIYTPRTHISKLVRNLKARDCGQIHKPRVHRNSTNTTAEVDRPPPMESSAQPTTQFAVSPVDSRSYSCLLNDSARNAILKGPYICKFICTMEIAQSMVFLQTNLHSVSYGEGVLRPRSIVL